MFNLPKLPKLPVEKTQLDHIKNVTFETEDGRKYTFFSARVWKLDFKGNLAYQILGEFPDLEQALPKEPLVKPETEPEKGSDKK